MPDTEPVEGLPAEQTLERPSAKYPTRELGRLLSYYKKNIKDFGTKVPFGVMKNIQSIIDKGVALEDIVTAMQNYEQARKDQDPQFTLGVRSFFSEEKIAYWLDPPKQATTPFRLKPALPEIQFTATMRPKPAVPVQAALPIVEDDEDFTL
jgi:hypothetical protein